MVEKCKPCVICMEKHVLGRKKMFTNRLNIGLPLCAWIEKTIHGVETHWLSDKEKVQGAGINEEEYADRLLWQKEPIINRFLKKMCYCKRCLFYQLSKVSDHSRGWPEGSLFNSLLHQCVGEGATPFPGLLHFTLDPYLIMLSVKQGGIKYHFLSLWYDFTWDQTQVSRAIGEHSNHLANTLAKYA